MAESDDRAAADKGRPAGGDVLLMVCMECGTEYQFEGTQSVPDDLKCEKCGNEVFRPFGDSVRADEARESFEEETHRDLATDDAEGDATSQDLHDLNK